MFIVDDKERKMAKSAQQRFNEYLDECRETREALGQFEKAAQTRYDDNGYAYIAGYMMTQLQDAIIGLPKARRAEFREVFLRAAKKLEQEHLMRTIKESA
jgi:hypothetical protein